MTHGKRVECEVVGVSQSCCLHVLCVFWLSWGRAFDTLPGGLAATFLLLHSDAFPGLPVFLKPDFDSGAI